METSFVFCFWPSCIVSRFSCSILATPTHELEAENVHCNHRQDEKEFQKPVLFTKLFKAFSASSLEIIFSKRLLKLPQRSVLTKESCMFYKEAFYFQKLFEFFFQFSLTKFQSFLYFFLKSWKRPWHKGQGQLSKGNRNEMRVEFRNQMPAILRVAMRQKQKQSACPAASVVFLEASWWRSSLDNSRQLRSTTASLSEINFKEHKQQLSGSEMT